MSETAEETLLFDLEGRSVERGPLEDASAKDLFFTVKVPSPVFGPRRPSVCRILGLVPSLASDDQVRPAFLTVNGRDVLSRRPEAPFLTLELGHRLLLQKRRQRASAPPHAHGFAASPVAAVLQPPSVHTTASTYL